MHGYTHEQLNYYVDEEQQDKSYLEEYIPHKFLQNINQLV